MHEAIHVDMSSRGAGGNAAYVERSPKVVKYSWPAASGSDRGAVPQARPAAAPFPLHHSPYTTHYTTLGGVRRGVSDYTSQLV